MATDIATSARQSGRRAVVGGAPSASRPRDRVAIGAHGRDPRARHGRLIWFPTISSIALSFTSWDGIGGLHTIHWIGTTQLPPDRDHLPAVLAGVQAQPLLARRRSPFVATPFGMFLAYLLDKEIRGTRIYQSVFYLPVVLSLAIIGFIWELIYSPTQGLVNSLFADPRHGHVIDWLGNPKINLWADARRSPAGGTRLRDDPLPGRVEGGRPVAARGGGDRRRQRGGARSSRSSSRRSSRSTSSSS